MSYRIPSWAALLVILSLGACATDQDMATTPSAESYTAIDGGAQLIMGNRTIEGLVERVTDDNIKVNIGELQPLFLPMKDAREKGFSTVKPGDKLKIVMNDQNLVVDFHPIGQDEHHRQLKGTLAQPLVIGHDRAVIRTADGRERSYAIKPEARSTMASISVGAPISVLLDETNQIVDVSTGGMDPSGVERKSPPKGAQQRIEGIIVKALSENEIRIRTQDGKERPYEVRSGAVNKLAAMRKGEDVILLVADDNTVVDVAIPPQGKN